MLQVSKLGALEICDGWIDGGVEVHIPLLSVTICGMQLPCPLGMPTHLRAVTQVYKFVTRPDIGEITSDPAEGLPFCGTISLYSVAVQTSLYPSGCSPTSQVEIYHS